VREHAGRRAARDQQLPLADLSVLLHDGNGLRGCPDRLSGWPVAWISLRDGRMN